MPLWKNYTKMKIIAIFLIFIIIPSINVHSEENKINILVSISDFLPIVKEIGRNFVKVDFILPPATDPHSFSLTKEAIDKIKKADLIILANSNLLSYEKRIKENYKKEYLDFNDYEMNNATLDDFDGFKKNPHGYWLKVENAIAIAKTIALKLEEIYPAHASYFELSFKIFKENIQNAKNYAINEIKKDGLFNKKVVASVPGVCYIAENFGIKADTILLSEASSYVSPEKLKEIEDGLRKGEYIGIVVPEFMKYSKPGEISRNIAEDTGSKVIYVKFSMDGESYSNIFYYNLIQFVSSNSNTYEKNYNKDLIILCISLLIFVIFEGGIIYELWKRK